MRPPSQLTLLSDSQAKAIERDQIECHISAAVTRHTCSLRADRAEEPGAAYFIR